MVDVESSADQVRPSVSAASRLVVSRWEGRTPRSSLGRPPPRGPSAPRGRSRPKVNLVSPRTVTASLWKQLLWLSRFLNGVRHWERAGHRMAQFHGGKWKLTQTTLFLPWGHRESFSRQTSLTTYCISLITDLVYSSTAVLWANSQRQHVDMLSWQTLLIVAVFTISGWWEFDRFCRCVVINQWIGNNVTKSAK